MFQFDALSGQENLLKHETTKLLLHLKWRFIPRFAFYFNLIFYLFYMLLFSLYTVDLSKFGGKNLKSPNLPRSAFSEKNFINDLHSSSIFYLLIVFLSVQLIRELFQIYCLDGISYFYSSQNLIEIFTYITSMISLLSNDYNMQSAYGSIAVLFAFILFPLFIQKIKMFGLYVVAFRRTLTNSAKFFPIFLMVRYDFSILFK